MNYAFILAFVLVAGIAGYLITQDTALEELEINGGVPGVQEQNDSEPSTEATPDTSSVITITPIAHATMVLEWNERILYIDPTGGADAFAAQPEPTLILLTDTDPDHLHEETLAAVMGPETVLVLPQAAADALPETMTQEAIILVNGEIAELFDFTIKAIPMYDLPETEDSKHPKGRGNGYVIETEDKRVYIAGDTSGIPEMRALQDIDLALISMNPLSDMDADEAAKAVLEFEPKTVYPYHYRTPDGPGDIAKFKELINAGSSDIEVVLLDWYPE